SQIFGIGTRAQFTDLPKYPEAIPLLWYSLPGRAQENRMAIDSTGTGKASTDVRASARERRNSPAVSPNVSGLRDNYSRGNVGDFLREKIRSGAQLSIVSAYFTIYAYDALKEYLDRIDHLDFSLGNPLFWDIWIRIKHNENRSSSTVMVWNSRTSSSKSESLASVPIGCARKWTSRR
ncbi:MAG TPA: hypothetical protein VG498_19625, partial [Terriglobales bacterium]|nr:hypothetical protein [Terriglobales bacterium]